MKESDDLKLARQKGRRNSTIAEIQGAELEITRITRMGVPVRWPWSCRAIAILAPL